MEEHYRVKEVSRLTGLSPSKVRSEFKKEPGVKLVYGPGRKKRKRVYATPLIPKSVLERWFREREVRA